MGSVWLAILSIAHAAPPSGQCGSVAIGCEANANCTYGAANCSVIGAFPVPADNGTATCCDLCINAEACQQWTVVQPDPTAVMPVPGSAGSNSTCWLRTNTSGLANTSRTCVSATLAPALPPNSTCAEPVANRSLSGEVLVNASFADPTLNTTVCCSACDAQPRCVGWVLGKADGKCSLLSSVNGTHWADPNITASGLQRPPPPPPPPGPPRPAPAAVGFKWVGTWRGLHTADGADGNNGTDGAGVAAVGAGTEVGDCGCSLIAPEWIITAGHCAERVLKHEKVKVMINFHGTKPHVERRVTHCIHAGDDQDVAICALSAQVHAFPSVKVNPVVMKIGHPAESVLTIGTKQGLKLVGPKKLKFEGNGDHLYVKAGGGMKAGDSGGPWVIEKPHGSRRYYLVGVLHGSGIAGQPSFIRGFLDTHIKGISWEKPP